MRAPRSAVLLALVACAAPTGPDLAGDAPSAETSPESPPPPDPPPPPALHPLASWDSDVGTRGESNDGAWLVKFAPEPDPVPLNDAFAVRVAVFDARAPERPAEGIAVSVDAGMPQHRHGMLRVPRVSAADDGTWLATGMLFHMPGAWELYVDVTRDGITERAQFDVAID